MTTNTNRHEIFATLLTDQQIWGDGRGYGQLEVMKSFGTTTGMSDFAVVLGGAMTGSITTCDGQPTGHVWSASSDDYSEVRTVNHEGARSSSGPDRRYCAVRPALGAFIEDSIMEGVANPVRKISAVDVVEYGEYPQTVAEETVATELDWAFSNNQLRETGKIYHLDAENRNAYHRPFNPNKLENKYSEYQLASKDGKIHKYVRVVAKPFNENSKLSNGNKPQEGEVCWIEVKPIEWLKDPSGMLVAKQALFAGFQFDGRNKYDDDFARTDMSAYLRYMFVNEIIPSKVLEHTTGVKENHEAVSKSEAKENMRHYQDIVAKGSLQDWSKRDFSAAPKQSHR